MPDPTIAPQRGGMGLVFKAHWARRGLDVAVKVLRASELSSADFARAAGKFQREAEALRLASEGGANRFVVPLFGVARGAATPAWSARLGRELAQFESQGDRELVGLVMAWHGGGSLGDKVHGAGRAAWLATRTAERLLLLERVADGVAMLHSAVPQMVVHGDISSAHVLLTDGDEPRLSNFGLAEVKATAASAASSRSYSVSSAADKADLLPGLYMAPEMYKSRSRGGVISAMTASRSTDVFALTTLCWEALVAERPWADDSEGSRLSALRSGESLDWSRLPGDTPVKLRALLERGIALDRTARPTARELCEGLRAARELLESGRYDVFISHAWEGNAESPATLVVRRSLRGAGYHLWVEAVDMGRDQQASMRAGIDASAVFVGLVSRKYASRPNCMLELRAARDAGKPIVSCLVEPDATWWPPTSATTDAEREMAAIVDVTVSSTADLRAACIAGAWASPMAPDQRARLDAPGALPTLLRVVGEALAALRPRLPETAPAAALASAGLSSALALGRGSNGVAAVAVAAPQPSSQYVLEARNKEARDKEAREKGKQLLEACEQKRAADALRLIDEGADINIADRHFGRTPLMFASRHDELGAVVTRLIGAGAKVDACDGKGMSALTWACYTLQGLGGPWPPTSPASAMLLLEAGASVNGAFFAPEDGQSVPDTYQILDFGFPSGPRWQEVVAAIRARGGRSSAELGAIDELATAVRVSIEQKRFAEAIPQARELLELRRSSSGPLRKDMLGTQLDLARLLLETSQAPEAELLAASFADSAPDFFGPTDMQTIEGLAVLGRARVSAGKSAEAEAPLREALQLRDSLPESHAAKEELRLALAGALKAQRKLAEAAEQLRLVWRERVLDAKVLPIVRELSNIVAELLAAGEPAPVELLAAAAKIDAQLYKIDAWRSNHFRIDFGSETIHESQTSIVVRARIVADADGAQPVALKFLRSRDQFDSEKAARAAAGARYVLVGLIDDGRHDGELEPSEARRVRAFFPRKFDGGADARIFVLCMYLCEKNLEDIIVKEGQAPDWIDRVGGPHGLFANTARALQALHAAGLVHGDVKPRNLMRESRAAGDGLLLIDLDASRAIGADMGRKRSEAYSPPEALAEVRTAGAAAGGAAVGGAGAGALASAASTCSTCMRAAPPAFAWLEDAGAPPLKADPSYGESPLFPPRPFPASPLHPLTRCVVIARVPQRFSPPHLADAWGLGCTLFQLLSLDTLLPARADDALSDLEAGIELLSAWDEPLLLRRTSVARFQPGVFESAGPLLRRLLARDPRDRPSMQAVLEDPFVSGYRFDVFLSYRWRAEGVLCEALYRLLTQRHKLKVFRDENEIRSGANIRDKFLAELKSTLVFVPLLSRAAAEAPCAPTAWAALAADSTPVDDVLVSASRPPRAALPSWQCLSPAHPQLHFFPLSARAPLRLRAQRPPGHLRRPQRVAPDLQGSEHHQDCAPRRRAALL